MGLGSWCPSCTSIFKAMKKKLGKWCFNNIFYFYREKNSNFRYQGTYEIVRTGTNITDNLIRLLQVTVTSQTRNPDPNFFEEPG